MSSFENMRGGLIYENPLSRAEDLAEFLLEGKALISFPKGRLRLENAESERLGQKANYVLWCKRVFPADMLLEIEFCPLREPGLAMLFFAASGRDGRGLFDPSLSPRTGEYAQSFVTLFDYAAAIAVFLLVKRLVLVTRPALGEGKTARRVCLLGSLAFGVYLLEPYFKVVLWSPYLRLMSPYLHAYPLSLLWIAAIFPLGALITWGLKKLPVLKKLL